MLQPSFDDLVASLEIAAEETAKLADPPDDQPSSYTQRPTVWLAIRRAFHESMEVTKASPLTLDLDGDLLEAASSVVDFLRIARDDFGRAGEAESLAKRIIDPHGSG